MTIRTESGVRLIEYRTTSVTIASLICPLMDRRIGDHRGDDADHADRRFAEKDARHV